MSVAHGPLFELSFAFALCLAPCLALQLMSGAQRPLFHRSGVGFAFALNAKPMQARNLPHPFPAGGMSGSWVGFISPHISNKRLIALLAGSKLATSFIVEEGHIAHAA